jgi:hypothetical protein
MARRTSSALCAGWLSDARRSSGLLVLTTCLLVFATSLLVMVPAASAASFTWTGESTMTADWSAGVNWEGDEAPTQPIETLNFPLLTRAVCQEIKPSEPCYFSKNDFNDLSVESMHVDASADYVIYGNELTLGSGGLSASPSVETSSATVPVVLAPIALGAAQTWNIFGFGTIAGDFKNQLAVVGGVTGSSHALTVNLGEGGGFDLKGENEVGPVALDGIDSSESAGNGLVGLFAAGLNVTDVNSVNVSHIFFYGSGGVGPLSTTDAELYLAVVGFESEYADGTLEADGATLDLASSMTFEIAGTGITPYSNYAQLISTGPVALGGAALRIAGTKSCATLSPGREYTLVSTTDGLSETFGNAPEGREIPVVFPEKCGSVQQKMRIAYNRTAFPETVTGTVIAGPTSSTTLSASPSAVVTNQGVTLKATVLASSGFATGTVEFRNGGSAIAGCAAEPVSADLATCQTSFPATASPAQLSAVFTPGAGVNLQGSGSTTQSLTVGKDSTTAALRLSNAAPTTGGSVTYTATVTPVHTGATVPTGTIEFLDGATPISSCASQPLTAAGSSASATCQLSYPTPGAHSIAARYAGDANFTGSSAPAQAVSVTTPAPAPGGSPGAAQQVAGAVVQSGEVKLTSTTVEVQSNLMAAIKLACTATNGCHGTLALSAQTSTKGKHGKNRSHTVSLGSASYTVSAGGAVTVKFKLNSAARALLETGHGRLSARLAILEGATGLKQTQEKGVHIVEQASGIAIRKGR